MLVAVNYRRWLAFALTLAELPGCDLIAVEQSRQWTLRHGDAPQASEGPSMAFKRLQLVRAGTSKSRTS